MQMQSMVADCNKITGLDVCGSILKSHVNVLVTMIWLLFFRFTSQLKCPAGFYKDHNMPASPLSSMNRAI